MLQAKTPLKSLLQVRVHNIHVFFITLLSIQSVGRHTVSGHFLTNYFHVLIHEKFNGVNWYWNRYW